MKGVQFNKKCNSIIVWHRKVKFWNNQLLALTRLHYKTMYYCEMVGISRPDSLVGEEV